LIDPVGQQIQQLHWQSAGLEEDSTQDEPDEDDEA
jgi:hypothetical protein